MRTLFVVGVAAVAIVVVFLALDVIRNPGASPVRTALTTARDTAVRQYQALTGRPGSDGPSGDAASPEARPSAAAASRPTTSGAPVVPEASATPDVPEVVAVSAGAAAPAAAGDAPVADARRFDFYVPGRSAAWARFDVTINAPTAIRAGGRLVAANDESGPGGLAESEFESQMRTGGSSAGVNERAVTSAPYLALVGRLCATDGCTPAFVIGERTVMCPADVAMPGRLELWTNNYIRVDGNRTLRNYSGVTGGYAVYVEPAPEGSCAPGMRREPAAASVADARALDAGQTLRHPEFVISSSQSGWKPFFVPLTRPLRIQASGSMQPRGGAAATGPDGIVVPDGDEWSYPGERSLVVDARHRLYDPSLPYQSLIGRLCGTSGCGPAFLVGAERVICPAPSAAERLELWINHIIAPTGLLGQQLSISLDAFDLQARRGAYRFEISSPATDVCGAP